MGAKSMKCLACFEGSAMKLFSFLVCMIKELQWRTETAQWCRTLAALEKDWGLTPSTPEQLVTASNSVPGDPVPSFGSHRHCLHMGHIHKCRQNTDTHKIHFFNKGNLREKTFSFSPHLWV